MPISRCVILSLVMAGATSVSLSAAPKADIVSSSWQLDFDFADPQRVEVVLPGDQEPTTFWYMLFTVTNRSGEEAGFYPSFELVTDTLKVVRGGEEIPPRIFDVIAARHRNDYPFFAPPHKITGPLLQGEENSRSSAVVFRDFDPEASSFTIYVAGLSGELARVPNPAASGSNGDEPRSFILRRTLAIRYDFPGDTVTRSGTVPIRRDREWVMR